jgi:hypothetical protein
MTDQELMKMLMATLNDPTPKIIGVQVFHDPDCPRLFGKPCTCNPNVKAKEIND